MASKRGPRQPDGHCGLGLAGQIQCSESQSGCNQPIQEISVQAQRESVLVIDDDESSAQQTEAVLRKEGLDATICIGLGSALATLPDLVPDLILATLDMADAPGLKVMQLLKEQQPDVPVIACTARPTVDGAVLALRAGAREYLARPIDPARLHHALNRIFREERAARELADTQEQIKDRYGFRNLLTRSPRMLTVFDQIRAVASTDATVLIRGETGTGKELVARAIHERSKRHEKPCISVNCGAFTETLLESELFGHEKGSFTGAAGRREGVFELSDGGTLFLDELGETSLSVQVNLLRVLEEMSFRRVGGERLIHVDVRIVAATNQDLETRVRQGLFRQDLFYRLNVFPIILPPLRERPEDIPLLLRHFLDGAAQEYDVEPPIISQDAMTAILAYTWPGNVRQLRALCERWVIVAGSKTLGPELLPEDILGRRPSGDEKSPTVLDEKRPLAEQITEIVSSLEKDYLCRLLASTGGRLQDVARMAGMTRRTLYNKMQGFGLSATDYRKLSSASRNRRIKSQEG
jgi:DNA-binding NtrC family response regulator